MLSGADPGMLLIHMHTPVKSVRRLVFTCSAVRLPPEDMAAAKAPIAWGVRLPVFCSSASVVTGKCGLAPSASAVAERLAVFRRCSAPSRALSCGTACAEFVCGADAVRPCRSGASWAGAD